VLTSTHQPPCRGSACNDLKCNPTLPAASHTRGRSASGIRKTFASGSLCLRTNSIRVGERVSGVLAVDDVIAAVAHIVVVVVVIVYSRHQSRGIGGRGRRIRGRRRAGTIGPVWVWLAPYRNHSKGGWRYRDGDTGAWSHKAPQSEPQLSSQLGGVTRAWYHKLPENGTHPSGGGVTGAWRRGDQG